VALRLWDVAKAQISEKTEAAHTVAAQSSDTSDSSKASGDAGVGQLRGAAAGLTLLIFVMVLSGGFVAGLKGGLMYNTFPKMGAYWMPAGLFPSLWSVFEYPATAQFVHRMMAYVVLIAVLAFWFASLRFGVSPRFAKARGILLVALLVQISLGIATLLWYVPVALATLHQAGALCLFTASLYVTFVLYRRTVS
jgi:cytochrome c oxidase assembly protein subunit 15